MTKSVRENQKLCVKKVCVKGVLPSVKKVEKRPKMAFTGTFDFHGKKKTLPRGGFFQLSQRAAFFFSVKIKSARESFFWPFFDFFHRRKMAFTHTFLEFFTGGRNFSRTVRRIFSRVGFFFHGREMKKFT